MQFAHQRYAKFAAISVMLVTISGPRQTLMFVYETQCPLVNGLRRHSADRARFEKADGSCVFGNVA